MRKPALIPLLLAALALGGCQLPNWQPGGRVHTSVLGDFTVRVPATWMFVDRPAGFLATNDGVLLQRAGIQRHELAHPLPYSKRQLTPTMTPLELAEAMADDLRADRAFLGLEIPEITPAEVGGRQGFKLVMRFHDSEGLRYTQAIYGCLTSTRLYLLHYRAPTRHYYARDAAAFDELARSFTLTSVGTLPPYRVAVPPAAK